jgi:hypothetical protein
LSPDEAAFFEALVNIMRPADELTPNGVDCGSATFIDRQPRRLFGKSVTRDRLRTIFPDQETYNDLARTLLAKTPFSRCATLCWGALRGAGLFLRRSP